MAAWRDEGRSDKTTESMMFPGPVNFQWFIGERLLERIKAMAQKPKNVVVNPPSDELEVPIHRIAEYIPGSFVATDDDEGDVLNDGETRFYKTADDQMTLVFNQGLLTFDCDRLRMVLDRIGEMSTTDLAEVLDLVED